MSDIIDNFNKLFDLYDKKLELSGILGFTVILIVGVLVLYVDSTSIDVGGEIRYNRFLPENIKAIIVFAVIAHMIGLYVYSRKMKEKLVCPKCKKLTARKCERCGHMFGRK